MPAFCPTLKKYKETFKVDPTVVIVKTVGASNLLETNAKREGIELDTWQFSGGSDYFSLPQLLPFLTKGSKFDLLMEIMTTPLPERKVA